MAGAYSKHKESGDSKGVKAHFRLDESGILHLDQVIKSLLKFIDCKFSKFIMINGFKLLTVA